ncbi:hypothetical protein K438DRAFT_1158727 [Mycena galopus ATCC 62051]|nr:hypothetical protein K438DRAFT_1158727 [Mycena galopus ATCC 62051]
MTPMSPAPAVAAPHRVHRLPTRPSHPQHRLRSKLDVALLMRYDCLQRPPTVCSKPGPTAQREYDAHHQRTQHTLQLFPITHGHPRVLYAARRRRHPPTALHALCADGVVDLHRDAPAKRHGRARTCVLRFGSSYAVRRNQDPAVLPLRARGGSCCLSGTPTHRSARGREGGTGYSLRDCWRSGARRAQKSPRTSCASGVSRSAAQLVADRGTGWTWGQTGARAEGCS